MEDLFEPQLRKIETIKQSLMFINALKCDKPETLAMLQRIKQKRDALLVTMHKVQQQLEIKKNNVERTKVLEAKIKSICMKMDRMENPSNTISSAMSLLTNNINEPSINEPSGIEAASVLNPDETSASASRLSQDEISASSSDLFTPKIKGNYSSSSTRVKPRYIIYDIVDVTKEEFAKLPKYMVGSITLSDVNTLISNINETLKKKYKTLSKARRDLRSHEVGAYYEFKQQEGLFPKGKVFFTETNLAVQLKQTGLSKRDYGIIVILRHVQRISESRVLPGIKTFTYFN